MKETKFRAWDKLTNSMWEWEHIVAYNYSIKFLLADTFHLMQYTGLKDKNGKEIYEGDIVQVGAGIMFPAKLKVEWLQFGYVLTTKDYINPLKNSKPENIQVVGSIYENPELLEGK